MKKLIIYLSILLSGCQGAAIAQQQVIKHKAYTTYYNPKIKGPDSVSWDLTPAMVSCGKVTRVDMFAQDPALNKKGPKPKDFVQISNDKAQEGAKGHLFSFEDAQCDPVNRRECFYVDQMYWQYQKFNAGDWKTIEVYERQLASKGIIHVIAGYIGIAQTIQKTGIIIPKQMYKAIYCQGHWQCWIMPNLPTSEGHPYQYWLVASLASFDAQTGLKL